MRAGGYDLLVLLLCYVGMTARFVAAGQPLPLDQINNHEAARRRIQRKFGNSTNGDGYFCVRVLPMGWISAVGITQATYWGVIQGAE